MGIKLLGDSGISFSYFFSLRSCHHHGWCFLVLQSKWGARLSKGSKYILSLPVVYWDAVPGHVGSAGETEVPLLGSEEFISHLEGRKLHETKRFTQAARCWEVKSSCTWLTRKPWRLTAVWSWTSQFTFLNLIHLGLGALLPLFAWVRSLFTISGRIQRRAIGLKL